MLTLCLMFFLFCSPPPPQCGTYLFIFFLHLIYLCPNHVFYIWLKSTEVLNYLAPCKLPENGFLFDFSAFKETGSL